MDDLTGRPHLFEGIVVNAQLFLEPGPEGPDILDIAG